MKLFFTSFCTIESQVIFQYLTLLFNFFGLFTFFCFNFSRKEKTNLAVHSCNSYVISRDHLFCKNSLCEACLDKIYYFSRDFIYQIRNKLAKKN